MSAEDYQRAHFHAIQDVLLSVASLLPKDQLEAALAIHVEASRTQLLQSSLPESAIAFYEQMLRHFCEALEIRVP